MTPFGGNQTEILVGKKNTWNVCVFCWPFLPCFFFLGGGGEEGDVLKCFGGKFG